MIGRLLLVVSTAALAAGPISPDATKRCLFTRVAPARKGAVLADVRAFKAEEIDPTATRKIRSMWVVKDKDGRQFFVRFPSIVDPTDFEVFASEFLAKAPGVQTPKLRRLTESETTDLIAVLKRDVPESAEIGGRATVAPFYPEHITGAQYLRSRGIDPEQVTLNQVKELPPELITQIADLWALETVLGIDDFHAENWMIHDGKVLAVDLANRSRAFKRGSESIDLGSKNPFGLIDLDSGTRQFLARQVSPAMRSYLRNLTTGAINLSAVAAQYPLSVVELVGMKNRIALILED